jgi:DUF917 family protein
MRELSPEDVDRLEIGAHFLSCSIDPTAMHMHAQMTRQAMRSGTLLLADLDDLADDDLVVSIGFVSQGLLMAEMPPVGDEAAGCIEAIVSAVGRPVAAVFPLAAANINAIAPLMVALQTDIPVADADPMGRVFPLISQTTLNAAGVAIGPIALMGATGERVTIEVKDARRAEALVRAATEELGGWAMSAMYPCTVRELRDHGVHGSISRMLALGDVLGASVATSTKLQRLSEQFGTSRIGRAQVTHVENSFGASEVALPARPSSLTLLDVGNGRVVRLEIQNEILMVLVDGAVAAAVPDVITLIDPEHGAVVSLDDVRVGDVLDLLRTPADPRWYEPAGLALAGPAAFGIPLDGAR